MERRTARVSSLDAARAVYFIILGLAVKDALVFLHRGEAAGWILRFAIVAAYLLTAFRFAHGVAVVFDIEKRAAERSGTPHSKRLLWVAVFFLAQAIALFLMADALDAPHLFALWFIMLLVLDLLYIATSKVVKEMRLRDVANPLYLRQRWSMTEHGTAPRVHLQWTWSDWALIIATGLTYLPRPGVLMLSVGTAEHDWTAFLAALLFGGGILDYAMNARFYFGGQRAGSKLRVVFVSSPLKPRGEVQLPDNIRAAQWYAHELLRDEGIAPLAPHAFFTCFLDDSDAVDRQIGRRCAIEYLRHCDAILLFGAKADDSDGMLQEERIARAEGLTIERRPRAYVPPEFKPEWKNVSEPSHDAVHTDPTWRRVFVCTAFTDENADGDVRRGLWVSHELARQSKESVVAPLAPQAYFPLFCDSGAQWRKAALAMLRICEVVYVYTEDGLDTAEYIDGYMEEVIAEAGRLGMAVLYLRYSPIPEAWATAHAFRAPAGMSTPTPPAGREAVKDSPSHA